MIRVQGGSAVIGVCGLPINIEYFPDGTPHIRVEPETRAIDGIITLEWQYEPNEEMALYYVARHIRETWAPRQLDLYMPYIPNARMDRVEELAEVFTLKYFCEFINSMKFDNVIVRDAHSSVSLALLDRVISSNISSNITRVLHLLHEENAAYQYYDEMPCGVAVYPDEGAAKRYSKILDNRYLFGVKKRNWQDGKIIGLEIHGDIPESPYYAVIIDDICSYGGTFLHTARKLKELGAERIYLYVTHCENSILKGELINSGLLERIYTTNSIYSGDHTLIHVIGE